MRLTENFTANVAIPFNIPGDYFYLDSASAGLITVAFFRDNKPLREDLTDIIAGWHASPSGGFDRVEIASSVTQALSFYISRGQVGNILVARPEWYDRAPRIEHLSYATQGIAPHADVVRFAYTVPAGKKFALQQMLCLTVRDAVAAPVGLATARLRGTPATGGGGGYLSSEFIGNVVGNGYAITNAGVVVCLPGDLIEGMTSDASTGGTVFYRINLQGISFDA